MYNNWMSIRQIPKSPSANNAPTSLTLITILLWSFGSLLSRLVAIQSQFVLLSLSFFFSFSIMLIHVLLSKEITLASFRKIPAAYLLIGPLGYFVYSVAITQSSRAFDSISETTILNNTWPVFTVLFADLFLIKTRKPKAIRCVEALGILLSFLSVVILVSGGNFASLQLEIRGILWGLLAGISYGLFGAYSGVINRDEQKVFLLTAIALSLLLISVPALIESRHTNPLTVLDIVVAFSMGALLDGLGYILWTSAIRLSKERKAQVSTIASLMFFLPFINLAIVRFVLDEQQLYQPYFILSLVLILASTYLIQKATPIAKHLSGFIHYKTKPKTG